MGRLILDDAGCLRLSDEFGDRTVPLWQPRHELGAGNGGVRVLDARGRTIVRVGGKASLGGGGVKTGWVKGGLVDERTGRELLERCPGNYFLVGEALVADRGR